MLPPPANQFVRDKQIQCKDVRMSIQTFDVTLDTLWGQGQIDELDIPVVDSIHVTILSITQVRECRYLQVATVHFLRLFFLHIDVHASCDGLEKCVVGIKPTYNNVAQQYVHIPYSLWVVTVKRFMMRTCCSKSIYSFVSQRWRTRGYTDVTCVATTMSHAWLPRCHMRGYHNVLCVASTIEFIHKTNHFCRL